MGCGRRFYVEGIDRPHEIFGGEVTANLFPMLGVQPMLGRGFMPEEETPAGRHVVMLSYEFRQEHMGGSGGRDRQGRHADPGDFERGR